MFRLFVALAVIGLSFANPLDGWDELDGRIVNGVDTTIEKHPYQVSLQRTGGSHFCGGSIISEDIIVTAAHCVQGTSASEIRVRLGSSSYKSGGELVAVKALKYHEGYNSKIMVNDVAVLKLASPVKQSASIRYVALASKTPRTGTHAVVTGWGVKCSLLCISLPNTLQEVEVNIVDEKACASSEYKYGSEIKETMVCAYATNKDACQGDSGGPLVANDELVGIVSWGRGCAKAGYPGVYCDVPSVHDWILKTAKEL